MQIEALVTADVSELRDRIDRAAWDFNEAK